MYIRLANFRVSPQSGLTILLICTCPCCALFGHICFLLLPVEMLVYKYPQVFGRLGGFYFCVSNYEGVLLPSCSGA
jgi:hypothetical protein